MVVKGGTLRLASPELVEPVTAASSTGSLTIAPGKPMEVAATLGDGGRSLEVRATVDHRAPAGRRAPLGDRRRQDWPIHVRRGRGGRPRAARRDARGQARGRPWSVRGDAALLGFEATGPALAGDRLALDRVAAGLRRRADGGRLDGPQARGDQPGRLALGERVVPGDRRGEAPTGGSTWPPWRSCSPGRCGSATA